MAQTLYRRNLFVNNKWFEITEEGLSIKDKTPTGRSETFLKFEGIGSKTIKVNKVKKGWLIATVIFFILGIGMSVF